MKRNLWRIAVQTALFLLPLGAGAFDFSPDASRVVSDPAYLPLGGQVFASTEYTYGNTGATVDNALGLPKSANTTPSNSVIQLLEYGFTDDFALRAVDTYQWVSTTTTFPNGTDTVTDSNGFIDPTFTALWRALDQKNHPISWDLTASFSPNLFNAQSADPTENGTVARGGDTETLGTAISQETRDFTFYLQGTLTYLNTRSVFNPGNNITTDFDPSWQYFLNVLTQTRFGPQWSLNFGCSETFNDQVNTSFVNGAGKTISSVSRSGEVLVFTSALNFHAIPNRLVLSVIYNHYFFDGVGNANETQPANSTTTDAKEENAFSGELRYVFF